MISRLIAALAGLTIVASAGAASAGVRHDGFVTRQGADLTLDGRAFRFAGSNNYYLMYRSAAMVDDVFADAAGAGFTVLRTWGFLDIGNQDDSNSVHHKENGVYFQYWDGTRPAYNDGADGLQHLDYVLKSARDHGIRLVVPLTNNWSAFGGMDQYVRWRGGAHHDEFYTDPVIRGWYQDWIAHVLNRTNSLTGVKYKDDPTVMAWELANEPRCGGSGAYPRSSSCTDATVTGWADEMSRYIRGVDRRHLVSAGDEGFLCTDRSGGDWTLNCADGVNSAALAALPAIDLASFHLYPDHWGKDAAWGTRWIETHVDLARRLRKPVMLGEFGLLDKATRNVVYKEWTDAAVRARIDGFLYWILSGVQDDGTDYPDYDGFTVYCPSPVCTTVGNAGDELRHGQRSRPPVADHDAAQTLRDEPVTLSPAANDVAYRTRVNPATIDLDPAAAGRQTSAAVAGGTFTLGAAGVVTFTPAAGFVGRATGRYTVRDEAGRTSNVAELRVTVKNRPGDPLTLASFETGIDGWAPASWQSGAGTVARTADFHPQGGFGLRVTTADGGWFGTAGLPEPVDLSGRSALRYEVRTGGTGTSYSIAVQTGDAYTWCQSTWGYVNAGTTMTVDVDLATAMSCDAAALADVRAVYLWFDGNGVHDVDYVRAE
ncbi:cellulase family glycosylhydrolase [Dactylosporangium sp. AC04546]|uniref:cellulase family glycosylhydrolase n=1 Tax=Dactylosporangium sp. AC04546 TaxID=2862460 RepID=UPI001EDCD386|nr:cellulase family glycosylhydrolase [Dactylosporangium sp. AC04546]WVK78659.1 cellulase family glycosylhydrolase [Dactylosporangium sp. AC04546]